MAENLSDFTASNLTCTESTNTCFDGFECNATNGDDDDQNSQNHSQDSNFVNKRSISPMGFFPFQTVSEELLREMAVKEGELLPKHDYLNRLRSGDLDSRVRREALDWILKVVFFFSFNWGPHFILLVLIHWSLRFTTSSLFAFFFLKCFQWLRFRFIYFFIVSQQHFLCLLCARILFLIGILITC